MTNDNMTIFFFRKTFWKAEKKKKKTMQEQGKKQIETLEVSDPDKLSKTKNQWKVFLQKKWKYRWK